MLNVTTDALRAIICSKSAISLQRGSVDPKFQIEEVAPPTVLLLRKTSLNVLSYDIKSWTDLSYVLSQFSRLADRQRDGLTEGQTEFSSLHRARGKN